MANVSKTILVIDDEPGYRDMIQYELEKSGYQVLTAAGGQEGLDLMQKKKVDGVVTDMKMSPMDGLDVVMAIKRGYPGVPIVLMTGYAIEGRVQQALAMKASACLRKPFNIDELHGVIHSFA